MILTLKFTPNFQFIRRSCPCLLVLLFAALLPQVSLSNMPPRPPAEAQALGHQPQHLTEQQTLEARIELSDFLSRFEAIRVEMVQAPGTGHQVANIHAMKRLRELGFEGRFQVIYHENVEAKLAYLLPKFNPQNKGLQAINTTELGNVELVSISNFRKNHQAEPMVLAISAARDAETSMMSTKLLNVEVLLQLQPRLWSVLRVNTSRDIYISSTNEKISLQHLNALGTVYQNTEIGNWETFLRQQMAGNKVLTEKTAALTEIARALPAIDLLPAYSIDFTNAPDRLIEPVILGLLEAMKKNPKLFSRPVVIPVFTEFQNSEHKVQLQEQLRRMGIDYVEARDATTPERIRGLANGKILVVQVGAVPHSVFEALFTRATLPALLEGKNLTNTMLANGRPFLNVTGSIIDIRAKLHFSKIDYSVISRAFQVFDASYPGAQPQKAISEYIIQLRDPKSAASEFFASYKQSAQSLNGDLIGQALLELKHAMKDRKLIPPPTRRTKAPKAKTCRNLFLK